MTPSPTDSTMHPASWPNMQGKSPSGSQPSTVCLFVCFERERKKERDELELKNENVKEKKVIFEMIKIFHEQV